VSVFGLALCVFAGSALNFPAAVLTTVGMYVHCPVLLALAQASHWLGTRFEDFKDGCSYL